MPKPRTGLWERTPGVWWIRWTDGNGGRHREKAGSKSDAKSLLTLRKAAKLNREKLPELAQRKILFGELLRDALEHSKEFKASYEDDLIRAKYVRPDFENLEASSIMPQQIQQWLSRMTTIRKWSPATRNQYKNLFGMVFRIAIDNGKASSNPAHKVKLLKVNNERLRLMSDEEESRLRNYITEHYMEHLSKYLFALNTGVRKGEQFPTKRSGGLHWPDVDWARKLAYLGKTKNGHPRYARLNQEAIYALKLAAGVSNGMEYDQPVFLSRYGRGMKDPRMWFEKAVKGANLTGVTWHTLRHQFASRCAMNGANVPTLMALLGHRDPKMSMRYSHLSDQHLQDTVDRLCDSPTDKSTNKSTNLSAVDSDPMARVN